MMKMRKSKNADKCLINALRLFSKGKDKEAKKEVNKAIKLDPSLYEGYQLLGWIHLTQNSYKAAEENFSTAESLVYKKAKNMRLDKATDIYQRGLVGNLVFMHFAAGMHSWMGNQFDDAESSFRRAIKGVATKNGFIEFLEKVIDLVRTNREFVNLFKIRNLLVFRESLDGISGILEKVQAIEKIDTVFIPSFPAVMEAINGKGVCIAIFKDFFHIIFLLLKIAEKQSPEDEFLGKIEKSVEVFNGKDEILLTYKKFMMELIKSFKICGNLETIPKEEQASLIKILLPLLDIYDTWSKVLPDKEARGLVEDRLKMLYDRLQSLYVPLRTEAEKKMRERLALRKKEPEGGKAEINFEEGKIKIGSTVKSKYKQMFELLEYFINKGEEVHWIEGLRIFDEWKKIRNDIYNLKTIFEVVKSRLKGPKGFFRENNLSLDITSLEKGFSKLEGHYSSNIIKARELTREVEGLVGTGKFNVDEVSQKITSAIKIYDNCSEAHILMTKLLKNNIEFGEKDLIPTHRFLKQIKVLEKVKNTAEYYKNKLNKIEWNKLKPEKREGTREEFENEIGFFLVEVQQDLDEMKALFDILTKQSKSKGLSLFSGEEFQEMKKLLEQDKIQELLEIDIIKQLRGITKGILLNTTPYLRKWKDKAIDNYITKILSDALYDASENIDFSKVSSRSSLKKYLLKLIKGAIYNDFFQRIRLTKGEWKDYREVEKIKEELRQKFGREPQYEEWKEILLEKKKRGEEYITYINEICKKAQADFSLREDITSIEDEESRENDIEKSDYAEKESEE